MTQRIKSSFVVKILGGLLIAAALGAFSLTQVRFNHPNATLAFLRPDHRPIPQGTVVDLAAGLHVENSIIAEATPGAPAVDNLRPGPAAATPAGPSQPSALPAAGPYVVFLPDVRNQPVVPTPISTKPEPPAVTPAAGWPNGLASQSDSKLGLHVVANNDPYIMEFVRRVRPRVMKSVDDLGWLSDVKLASPNTVTIGRISGQDETWHFIINDV